MNQLQSSARSKVNGIHLGLTIRQYLEVVQDRTGQRYRLLPRRQQKQIDALRSLGYLKLKLHKEKRSL